ncbi:MAG: V-type ATPase 116kDa subunit family protein [Candidatus Korarchaeota archaeon]|nr:V-type ATPase 116kDa subunit family protein [Candidatus Korarchaeota archaeon]
MLKPEKVVRFYAYTTKLHVDDMAEALMEFDDVHVEPPEGLPGVKPPEGLETPDLNAYEEIIRALERASALTGISLEDILNQATSNKIPETVDHKELISELDELVGKYLSLRKELELAKKAKSLLKERANRLRELEEKLEELEMKIKEYYAAALEITEENPAKLRLGRMLLEIDRDLLRASSLVNAALNPSMSINDIREILRNLLEPLSELEARLLAVQDELKEEKEIEEVKRGTQDLKEILEEISREIEGYMVRKDKLSELKAVESLWNKMRDTVRKVPELSPLLVEREPAIAKVTQQIADLENEISRREGTIREKLQLAKKLIANVRETFIRLRDRMLTIKAVAAGEAEQRVSELIEGAKPIISEKGKLEEEIKKLEVLSNKEEVGKLKEEAEKLLLKVRETAAKLASKALSVKPRAILQKLKKMTYVGEEIAVISGWVPSSKIDDFERSIKDKLGNYVALELEEPKKGEGVPSKVKLPTILRPVRLLTHRLYGLPSIRELDPTPITAIFFPLMFGMMYGDVGHGLTLALFGALLWGRSRGAMKELAGLLIYSGMAAAFFGYLYGMIYFMEFTEHPILSPLHDTMRLMAVALLFGAFELMVGFVMNTINKLLEGDIFAALFEYKGATTLIMYAGAVYAVIRNNADIMGTITDPLFISMVVPLSITATAPVIRAVREGHGIGEGMSEMIATLLESVLALFSNSLSYIRLAAFAVIHEVFGVLTAQLILGKEIATLSDLGSLVAPGALIGFVFMNIAVMGLEGMLSFIQATRLTFYEFFSKFYKAAGREFKRVSELLGPALS